MAITPEVLLETLRNFPTSASTAAKLRLLRNAHILDENGDLEKRFFSESSASQNGNKLQNKKLTPYQLAILRKPVVHKG